MKSNFKRLGDYIQLVDNRNTDLEVSRLLGINITKNFMPSVANVTKTDLSKYKIIRKGQFAYSAMQVGRDETVRVALFTDEEPAIISPAYLVFEVVDENTVFPEFLMMWFSRPESDRFGWFISDGSVRASLEWERFCEIQIPIPDVDEQRKYVVLYKATTEKQRNYEDSLDDLQLICDSFMDALAKNMESQMLGDYIKPVDERNTDLKGNHLIGISVQKKFIPSKSNKEKLNLANYKIVKNKQFGYVTVTSRNGDKISIALRHGKDGLLSNTYIVFEVIDTKLLLPEFLFLWFQRAEFDRYARFHSWGSARETFDWDEMCAVKLPIPDIEIQKSIVAMYRVLRKRKQINTELKNSVSILSQVLMRGVVQNSAIRG